MNQCKGFAPMNPEKMKDVMNELENKLALRQSKGEIEIKINGDDGGNENKENIEYGLKDDGIKNMKLEYCKIENIVYILNEIVIKNEECKWYEFRELIVRYFKENKIDGKLFIMMVKKNTLIAELKIFIDPNNVKLDWFIDRIGSTNCKFRFG